MRGLPNCNLKKHLFQKTKNTISYADNFPIEWITPKIQYNFRNLNHFPLNPLNEYKTIMQSKNCQELPFKHGNFLVYDMAHNVDKWKN